MVLDAYRASSPKSKVLNGTFVLLNFMAWVSCCVSFGGVQFTATRTYPGGTLHENYYWNKFQLSDGKYLSYDDAECATSECSKCSSGGKGLIAMQVFAFLGLTAALALSVVRVLGLHISFLEPTRKILFFELAATALNSLWFFLSVVVFGGTCFHAVSGMTQTSVTGTGFAYLICCFLFLLMNAVVIYQIRGDSSTHLGSGAGGDYMSESDNTTNYNPPATYQYSGDAGAYSAAAYNGDVMPAAHHENNL